MRYAFIALILLAGCGRSGPISDEVRPVRLATVAIAEQEKRLEYSGEIRPRVEVRQGFRVGGKIVGRLVEVGARVNAGQPMAKLDAQDYVLAQHASEAQVQAARTDRDLTQADYKRFSDLASQGFISSAELDRRRAAFDGAQARLRQAETGLRSQANQAAYTTLLAEADGIVTAIEAEVGQVVAAGQPVVRVARDGEKELAIVVPESQVGQLRQQEEARVRLWANPGVGFVGRIREIAPAADPVTRTYPVRLSLPEPPSDLRLGMTATAVFTASSGSTDQNAVIVPLTALMHEKGQTQVWVYDDLTHAVMPKRVAMLGVQGNDVRVTGLQPGQKIVTAGVTLLKPGMKVKPLDDIVPPATSNNAPSATKH